MRLAPILAATLLLSACPQSRQASEGQPADGTRADASARIAIAFGGTENDLWTSEILTAIGARLGFDPWSKASQAGHLDVFGPYGCRLGDRPVSVSIALSGIAGISDMLSQQALGEELRSWIQEQEPALAWLDGDQLQLFTGRAMEPDIPLVFTGAVGDQEVYYQPGRNVTGVYKRHSLPGVMKEIWQRAPEAKRIALLGDGSPASEGQLLIFQSQLELAYFKDQPCIIGERVKTWSELSRQLSEVAAAADGIILCLIGAGNTESGFAGEPSPAGLFDSIAKPAIALGPSALDQSGALVLSLKPVEHVKYALLAVEDILGGKPAAGILPVTPPEMEVFQSQRSDPASAAEAQSPE